MIKITDKAIEQFRATINRPAELQKTMTKEKLLKVISYLEEKPLIDDEDIRYFPEKYSFSYNEYRDVFDYLAAISPNQESVKNSYAFPEYKAYFKIDGIRFIWRLLIGQGSCTQLIAASKTSNYKSWKEFDLNEAL